MLTSFFDRYLTRWNLQPDGEPTITPTSGLLPVRTGDGPAMLKVAGNEPGGGALMKWWSGEGAAEVFAFDDTAMLMERSHPGQSLAELARCGRDDDATRILCAVVARLHAARTRPPADLTRLEDWFVPLGAAAETWGGDLRVAATVAAGLLASPRDATVLHGDIHHGNVLDFGARGWLAIDPKGLVGERYFDYANVFCNPDVTLATTPGRLARQVDVVAAAARLDRLLDWAVAWAGLSVSFLLEDGLPAEGGMTILGIAVAELHR